MIESAGEILNRFAFNDSYTADESDKEFELELDRAVRNKRIKGWLLFAIYVTIITPIIIYPIFFITSIFRFFF